MEYKKRIVISGYYGFDNIGDEAVLYSIIQALRKELEGRDIEITVLSNQPEKTSKLYDVQSVNRWDIKEVNKVIKASDLLISGGGSLLQDVTSIKTIPYYLLIVKIAQWHRKKIVFYSQGIGPVNKWYSKYFVRRIVNKVDYIFVRDRESKETLINMGVEKPTIEIAADPVLGMSVNKKSAIKINKERLKVGIYLRSWKNDAILIEKIRTLSRLLYEEGLEIFFIPMHQPEDRYFMESITALEVPHNMIAQELGVEEVFTLTGQMDIVVSMRLHALIMATAQNVPVVALSYDPKVNAFMHEIENRYCFDTLTFHPEEVVQGVRFQLQSITEQKKRIMEERNKLLKDKAYKPAKLIGQMLD